MSAVINYPYMISVPSQSNKVTPLQYGLTAGVFRLPTDPLFTATMVLQNIVIGSRYRITRTSTGDELAAGVAGSTEVTLNGLSVYDNPQQVTITVRKGTSGPKYKPFDTAAYMSRGTTAAYISQQTDPIA